MKIVFDTNIISPHTAPLALALAKVPRCLVRYMYRQETGYDMYRTEAVIPLVHGISFCVNGRESEASGVYQQADVVLEDVRDFARMIDRVSRGCFTLYMSERWFKPLRLDALRNAENACGRGVLVSGFLKMIFPFALKRARKMMCLMRDKRRKFIYLPNGIVAARDMARLCGLMNGDLRCFFRAPKLEFEARPGGRIWACDGHNDRYCLDRMRMWGYFVSPSTMRDNKRSMSTILKVLWMGRMIGCKRVETLIQAVKGLPNVELDIFGAGPDETRIKRLAKGMPNVHLRGLVSLSEVRRQMRLHDVYVLSSNSIEGWGAVVNEAIEEGMRVVGTYEAGASATILPETNLFHAGDWRRLREILQNPIPSVERSVWSAEAAAKAVVEMAKECGVYESSL